MLHALQGVRREFQRLPPQASPDGLLLGRLGVGRLAPLVLAAILRKTGRLRPSGAYSASEHSSPPLESLAGRMGVLPRQRTVWRMGARGRSAGRLWEGVPPAARQRAAAGLRPAGGRPALLTARFLRSKRRDTHYTLGRVQMVADQQRKNGGGCDMKRPMHGGYHHRCHHQVKRGVGEGGCVSNMLCETAANGRLTRGARWAAGTRSGPGRTPRGRRVAPPQRPRPAPEQTPRRSVGRSRRGQEGAAAALSACGVGCEGALAQQAWRQAQQAWHQQRPPLCSHARPPTRALLLTSGWQTVCASLSRA